VEKSRELDVSSSNGTTITRRRRAGITRSTAIRILRKRAVRSVHAVFENGVFRPIERVDLPERSEVLIDVRPAPQGAESGPVRPDHEWDAVYEILSRSYATGEPDLAARHDEHQP
jgi:predicted DNA-binding antitoxin AbrB/MazE fold protein